MLYGSGASWTPWSRRSLSRAYSMPTLVGSNVYVWTSPSPNSLTRVRLSGTRLRMSIAPHRGMRAPRGRIAATSARPTPPAP